MRKIFLVLFIYLWSFSAIAQDADIEEHNREVVSNPCGKDGEQRDILTMFYQHEYKAIYKELNKEEIDTFLKRMNQEDSDIVNVRVLFSPLHDSYAIISSYLFQNFLDGNLLVELYCIKRINRSLAIFIKGDMFEEFLGRTFLQLGTE
jgi:hypothetical protein